MTSWRSGVSLETLASCSASYHRSSLGWGSEAVPSSWVKCRPHNVAVWGATVIITVRKCCVVQEKDGMWDTGFLLTSDMPIMYTSWWPTADANTDIFACSFLHTSSFSCSGINISLIHSLIAMDHWQMWRYNALPKYTNLMGKTRSLLS